MKNVRNVPLISVCIPTYNRSKYLLECLKSLKLQQNDFKKGLVEIVISDNFSSDNTQEAVKKFKMDIPIFYFRNNTNIGMRKNLIKVAEKARGKYIWFLSDDDLHKKGAIVDVIKIIERYMPDIIFSNVEMLYSKTKQVTNRNLLKLKGDIILNGRRIFFKFLSKKFIYEIDWFTTYYSNLVIKRKDLFRNPKLFEKYSTDLDIFPHVLPIYCTQRDYNTYIIARPLLLFRADNISYGPREKRNFLIFWDKALFKHYREICALNNDYLPWDFKIKVFIKDLVRKIRIIIIYD